MLQPPPGRQGPGPVPAAIVDALALSLARRGGGVLPGDRLAPGVGCGTELAQLRPYQLGDDVRQLDPAASARTGVAHVRLQVPERILTTWLVLDLSASMAFGTADRLKSDVAEGVAHVIGRTATRHGGRLAVLTAGGAAQGAAATRRAACADRARRGCSPRASRSTAPPTAGSHRCCTRTARLARQPGLVVVVSDFRGAPRLAQADARPRRAPPRRRGRDPRSARGAPRGGRPARARRSRERSTDRGRHVA